MQEFLNRTEPFLGPEGLDALASQTIAIAGLGGVGGGAFLALVRCGCSSFHLAENGIFDPPDMNRQAGAFGHSMDRPKLDVYLELARSINPDIHIRTWPEGTQPENIDDFLQGTDAYVGVIDAEKGAEVKAMSPDLLKRHQVPLFCCAAFGFGALMINYHPDHMMQDEFDILVRARSTWGEELIPSVLARHFNPLVVDKFKQGVSRGIMCTTAIGGLASNALLANEVLVHLLQGTKVVEREPVFAPQYVTLDFMNLEMRVHDITQE
ncbi:MAG: ThiF family adenylyltransferase [Desulfovermiculus sp.]